MEQQLEERLQVIEQKLDATYRSAEKTRKYFLWMLAVAVVSFVLPIVALSFVIPFYLQTISSSLGRL